MNTLEMIAKDGSNTFEEEKYCPRSNWLFKSLYDAYCRINDINDSFASVIARASGDPYAFEDAFKWLTEWYEKKYTLTGDNAQNEQSGKAEEISRGIDRQVKPENVYFNTYYFGVPVRRELFKAYLITGQTLSKSDAYSFILHTSVAFFLSTDELDELLEYYRFLPLHVRNIHHMAIYVTLRSVQSWTKEERATRNPFDCVKKLYFEARSYVIARKDANELDNSYWVKIGSASTREVQSHLFAEELTEERYLAYVSRHTEFYNMRHIRLLTEHRQMAVLFSDLYKTRRNHEDLNKARENHEKKPKVKRDFNCEGDFYLYNFINSFCKGMDQKRFNDNLYNYIAQKYRHPTREIMIILWIFSYSFLFSPDIVVPERFLTSHPLDGKDSQPAFKKFVKRCAGESCILNVAEYLSANRFSPLYGIDATTRMLNFNGKELIAFLNDKLKSYFWYQLDDKRIFDRNILRIGDFRINLTVENKNADPYYNIERIFYQNREIFVDNSLKGIGYVPGPLIFLFTFLEKIKEANSGRWPLPCDLYELI